MKSFLQIFIAMLMGMPTYAADPRVTQAQFEKLLNSPPTSMSLQRIIGKEYKLQLGPNISNDATLNAEVNPATLTEIADRYANSKKMVSAVGTAFVTAPAYILKTGLTVAGALSFSTVMGPIVAYAGLEAIDATQNKLIGYAQAEGRKVLASDLAHYRDSNNTGFMALIGKSPQQVYREIYGKEPLITDAGVDAALGADTDEAIAAGFIFKTLKDEMIKNDIRQLANNQYQQQEIDNSKKQIVAVSRAFKQFAEDTTDDLNILYNNQNEIQKKLTELNGRVNKNSSDIAFLNDFVYGKMTPAERIQALEKGMMDSHLSQAEIESQKEKLKLVIKWQQVEQTAIKVLDGANNLVTIARAFHVDDKVLNAAQQAINIGNTAMNAAALFGPGNYLGAAAAISSLFTGGLDAGAERHAQIVQALNQILQGQAQIMSALQEGFDKVIKNQQMMYEAITALSVQIAQSQRQNMEMLLQIQQEVLVNRTLVVASMKEEFGGCSTLIDRREEFGYQNGFFPSYDKLVSHYNENAIEFSNCLNAISKKFSYPKEIHEQFKLQTYANESNDPAIRSFRKSVYLPALNFLNAISEEENRSLQQLASSLYYPVSTVEQLNQKLNHLGEINVEFKLPVTNYLNEPFSVEFVGESIDYLIQMQPYYQILDNLKDGKPRPIEELMQMKDKPFTTGRYYLTQALDIVNAAIAQQSLVAGDLLLPVLSQHILKKGLQRPKPIDPNDFLGGLSDAWSDSSRPAWDVLTYNPVLAKNVLTYIFQSHIASQPSTLYKYDVGFHYADSDVFLQNIFKNLTFYYSAEDRKQITTNDNGEIITANQVAGLMKDKNNESTPARVQILEKGWSAVIGGNYIALPTPEEVANGQFQQTPDLDALLRIKGRLVDAILDYDFVSQSNMNSQQISDFNRLLMKGI